MTTTAPLIVRNGHLFLELKGDLWLVDTGAPSSLGRPLELAGRRFALPAGFMGVTPERISNFVGVPCAGLLGGNVLNAFDHRWDFPAGLATITAETLPASGMELPLDDFMGIPLASIVINNKPCRVFFDTGAQFSYLRPEHLKNHPAAGTVRDFHPTIGVYDLQIHTVPIAWGPVHFVDRCGTLPAALAPLLPAALAEGILGNAILTNRSVGYYPRRGLICL